MKRPLPPIVIAFATGLVFAHHSMVSTGLILAVCSIVLVVCILLTARKKAHAASAGFLALFACLGALSLQPFRAPLFPSEHIVHYADTGTVNIEAVVTDSPSVSPLRTRLRLSVCAVHTPGKYFSTTGTLMLTIRKAAGTFRCGDRIRFLCRIKRPKNFENPGRFDYVRHLAYRSVFATAFLYDDSGIVRLAAGEASRFVLSLESFREKARSCIDSSVAAPARHILKALVLGDREGLPERVRDRFARLGIAHLLAISGLHLGIVSFLGYCLAAVLLRLLYPLLLHIDARKTAAVFSLFPAVIYCFIAGMQLPTIRAVIMIGACCAALLLCRLHDTISTLFLAAFIILIAVPTSLFSVSFQLSFAGVLWILILVPPLYRLLFSREDPSLLVRNNPVPGIMLVRIAGGMFLTSAAAVLGTAPIVAGTFHRISLIGCIVNLAFIPYMGFFILPTALIATAMLFTDYAAAQQIFALAGRFTEGLLGAAAAIDSWGTGDVPVAGGSVFTTVLYYALLAAVAVLLQKKKIRTCCAVIAACCLIAIVSAALHRKPADNMRVTFLDVGSGDSAIVEFPEKTVMLIDGGGFPDGGFDTGRFVVAPALYALGILSVDYVVATHPHSDHVGGLGYIIENFGVHELWLSRAASGSLLYRRLLNRAESAGVQHKMCSASSAPLSINGVDIEVLSPDGGCTGGEVNGYYDANNNSLVIKITYGSVRFLFTGDILAECEERLVDTHKPLEATIIKVPHHGRKSSSSRRFVNAVSAQYAVISCRGRTGPAPSVVASYRDRGALIYRTDIHGAITVETDGSNITVSSALHPF